MFVGDGMKRVIWGMLLTALLIGGTGCSADKRNDSPAMQSKESSPVMDENGSSLAMQGKESSLVVHEEEIAVPGLQQEFEIVFMADTHVSLCDERDPELMEKAASRYESFRDANGEGADESFQAIMDYTSGEEPDLVILGGDIVDSAMWASIDFVQESLEALNIPWIYGMGNHDFEYGAEYFSDKAYTEYLPRLSETSGTEKGYQFREYEDFIILAVDDKNNQVCEDAVEALEGLYEKGKPVILVTHVPVEPMLDDTLTEETKKVWGPSEDGHSRVLMGPDSCMPNETTQRFLDLVLEEESPVVLVLSGHIHFYHRDMLTEELPQIVTGAGFQKEIVKVTLTCG